MLSVVTLTLAMIGAVELDYLFPVGGRPGSRVSTKAVGASAGMLRAVSPLFGWTSVADHKLTISIPSDAPLGLHAVWVSDGKDVSSPVLFLVDPLPSFTEESLDTDRDVPIPCAIDGEIEENEEDRFFFIGKKQQRLAVDVWANRLGSSLDVRAVIRDRQGRVIAELDDSPVVGVDCRGVVTIPADGRYSVTVHDSTYSIDDRQPYRLRLGGQFAANVFPLAVSSTSRAELELSGGTLQDPIHATIEPARDVLPIAGVSHRGRLVATVRVDDFPSAAATDEILTPTTLPIAYDGRIEGSGGSELSIRLPPGKQINGRIIAATAGSLLDPVVTVTDGAHKKLTAGDDFFRVLSQSRGKDVGYSELDPRFTFTVPTKDPVVKIRITDRLGRGGLEYAYRLVLDRRETGFALSVDDAGLVVPKGGTGALKVDVARQGCEGAIELRADVPAGWSTSRAVIPAGQKSGYLTVTNDGADSESDDPAFFRIVGRPTVHPEVSRIAAHEVWVARDRYRRLQRLPSTWKSHRFPLIVDAPSPRRLIVNDESSRMFGELEKPVEFVVRLVPPPPDAATVTIDVLGDAPGLETNAAYSNDGVATVTLKPKPKSKPAFPFSVVVRAVVKQGDDSHTLIAPAVTVILQPEGDDNEGSPRPAVLDRDESSQREG